MKRIVKLAAVALGFWGMMASAWFVGRISMNHPAPLKRNERVRLDDLGELQKYRQANSELMKGPARIVFFGDSITYLWDLKRFFPGADYINRGIGGQTSADMVVRFRQDVIELQPQSVIILAGINDFIWRNPGSDTDEQTLKNLKSNEETMAELAELHHIRPVFVSLLPVHNYTREAQVVFSMVPKGVVIAANQTLRKLCSEHGYQYIDDYSEMVDNNGMLQKDLSDDGVHPNDAGYRIMAQVFLRTFHQ